MATRDAKVKLKADTSGYRRSMDRAAGSTRRVSVSLRGIGRAAGGALRSVAGLAVKMTAVGAAGAAVAGILAARKAYGLLAESIDLVGVQLEAERNLQSVLNNQRAAGVKIASDLADRLKKQASALQEVGTTGDEVTIRGQAQLATFRGLIPHIERASEVMLQLSEFTGQDAVNAANLLGKAAEGQIGALSRYGISLSDTAKKTKDIGLILEEVSSQLPTLGVSASTARGRLAQLGNQVGDLKEQIGEALTPAIKGAVAAVRPMVGRMQEWVAANREWLQTKFNDGLRMAGAAVGEIASRVAGFINSGGLAAMAEGFRLVVDWIKAGAAGLRTMIAVGSEAIAMANKLRVDAAFVAGGASMDDVVDARNVQEAFARERRAATREGGDATARALDTSSRFRNLAVRVDLSGDEATRKTIEAGIESVIRNAMEERERQKMADAIQAFSDVQAALPI